MKDGNAGDEELDPLDFDDSDEWHEDQKAGRRESLEWLAERGLCSLSDAIEYFESQSVPASKYARITRNYVPVYHEDLLLPVRFTVCKPEEYPLLEIWQRGYGPNISHCFAVVTSAQRYGLGVRTLYQ
jgi:hypothetical protein